MVRRKVTARLAECAERLPDDLRLVATASLAMHPDAEDRFLTARLQWAGDRLERDERTVRRYADDAVRLLAEHLESGAERPPVPTADWQVDVLESVYRVRDGTVEVYERRRLTSAGAALTHVETAISLPRPDDAADVRMELLYGGRVSHHERIGDRHLRWRIELAEPLTPGRTAEVALRYVMAGSRWLAPHYVFVPLHPCRRFRLVLTFDPAGPPATVLRLDGLPQRAVDDPAAGGETVVPDRFGELVMEFDSLRQGLSYGARWQR